jgi:hypothetical protein
MQALSVSGSPPFCVTQRLQYQCCWNLLSKRTALSTASCCVIYKTVNKHLFTLKAVLFILMLISHVNKAAHFNRVRSS